MSQYTIKTRDFSKDSIISAPVEVMRATARQSKGYFEDAKWIYSLQYVRFHTFRQFGIREDFARVEAAFECDNVFDLYLNGEPAAKETNDTGMLDITALAKKGENILHLTVYQTASDDHVISALIGGVRVTYRDGTVEEIVTDRSFKRIQFINFWENEEPEGFATATESKYGVHGMLEFAMHPAALRRSYLFRRSFAIGAMPERACLNATALGMYEAYVNGERVSDARFLPSSMEKCKEYQCFDILPLLKKGENVITFVTGNGWYNSESWGSLSANVLKVIADIELTYADGKTEYVRTDDQFLCCPGPMTEDDVQYGEKYDANLEREDAFTPDCDRDVWKSVRAEANGEYKTLVLQSYPYVRAVRTHDCCFMRFLPDGSPLFDAGTELAGRAVVTFRGLKKGQKVRIRYCERFREDGMPENTVYGAVYYNDDTDDNGISPGLMRNMDVYTAKGPDEVTYDCRFSYTGFRYIWIEGLTNMDQLVKLYANELHNDVEETGFIESSNEDINWIYSASKGSWLNNICNGPTDCPTREKNFWNGDTYMFADTACYLTDNNALLSVWTDKGRKMGRGAYGWDEEEYCLPITLYRFYGNREILRAKFGEMLRLIERRTPPEGQILPTDPIGAYFGDWLSPQGIMPSREYFMAVWYYRCLHDTAYVARVIGENEKAEELEKRAQIVRDEFNRRFILPDGSDTTEKCQGAIVFALRFRLCNDDQRSPLAKKLVEYIEREDWHLTTGFLSSRFLMQMLCDEGYEHVAAKLLLQKSFPSWLGIKATGADNMTESWFGTKDPDRSISMCHFAYGSVTGWMFEYLGGIRVEDSEPGLGHVVLRPVMLEEIGDFKCSYKTEHGVITTEWHFENGKPVFHYTLPEGITAEVIL